MTSLDQQFLATALELARAGMEARRGGPFGAVVVLDSHIVGTGQNCVTSSHDPTAHAEIVAIRDACAKLRRFDLRGGTIYTSCEPCPMCLGAILWARLERVVFAGTHEDAAGGGFDDATFLREFTTPCLLPRVAAGRAERAIAQGLFRRWRELPERIDY